MNREPRSNEAIRADLATVATRPPAVPNDAASRLAADVEPPRARVAELEQENKRQRVKIDGPFDD